MCSPATASGPRRSSSPPASSAPRPGPVRPGPTGSSFCSISARPRLPPACSRSESDCSARDLCRPFPVHVEICEKLEGDSTMTSHRIGTREEWLAARAGLLEREKQLTRMGDELARQRRKLPWLPVEKEYTLQAADGARTLAELFDGRSQLVIYHFMFGPGYTAGCPACSSTADSFNGVLAHLKARDVTMICVSRAPIEKLLAYRERMGWSFTWASSHDSDFNVDFGVSAGDEMTHDPAAPRLEANELALLKLLNDQPAVREN